MSYHWPRMETQRDIDVVTSSPSDKTALGIKCVRCDDNSRSCDINHCVVFNCGQPLQNGAPAGIAAHNITDLVLIGIIPLVSSTPLCCIFLLMARRLFVAEILVDFGE